MISTRDLSEYVRNNVLPLRRGEASRAGAHLTRGGGILAYSAASVSPLRDAGGFNSVIELALSTCRAQVVAAMRPVVLERGEPAALGTEAVTRADGTTYELSLSPGELVFSDAQTVALRFAVTISRIHRVPDTFHSAFIDKTLGGPPSASPTRTLIGVFDAELRAPLVHRDEPSRACTRVCADLRRASWTDASSPAVAASSPLGVARARYFSDWQSVSTTLLGAPLDLPLTPTLSLVGSNPGNAPVTTFAEFSVQAFAITATEGWGTALAVAFDIMPGCHGFVEDVRHFIGPNPYGVISDERVVDSSFRHHFMMGGFDRVINVTSTVRLKTIRNGEERLEDAVAYGYQELTSLDYAMLTTDSNTRRDCVATGGAARLVVTSVRMVSDGLTLDASEVDLGPPRATPWAVNAQLELSGSLDPDIEVRDFQLKFREDGALPLALPFARGNFGATPPVTHGRVDGVTRHVFFLGNLPNVLS